MYNKENILKVISEVNKGNQIFFAKTVPSFSEGFNSHISYNKGNIPKVMTEVNKSHQDNLTLHLVKLGFIVVFLKIRKIIERSYHRSTKVIRSSWLRQHFIW